MRRVSMIAAASLVAVMAAAAPVQAGIGLRVTGGIAHVAYGDFNRFVDYVNGVISRSDTAAGAGPIGKVDRINWVPEGSFEVLYGIVPRLTVGAGAGVISGSSKFTFSVGGNSLSFKHEISAYPFTATAYVDLPVTIPFARPYAFLGGDLFYSKISFTTSVTSNDTTGVADADLSHWGVGLHGGAGLEVTFAPRVSVDLSVQGRYARMKGYRGTVTLDGAHPTDVFLASYVQDGVVNFGPESVADMSKFQEGSVDLSGFGINIAVKVSF
jgi:opacity protein-like surface antigen